MARHVVQPSLSWSFHRNTPVLFETSHRGQLILIEQKPGQRIFCDLYSNRRVLVALITLSSKSLVRFFFADLQLPLYLILFVDPVLMKSSAISLYYES
jgi:hypothetical protein